MPLMWTSKDIVKLVLFFLFIAIIVYAVSIPKDMATYDQVWSALEAQGYEPLDAAESYSDYYYITDCIGAQSGDIKFTFFVCTDEDGARNLYQHYHSIFVLERRHWPYAEYITQRANFVKYGLSSNGKYSVVVRVGSTLVYAESDEENMKKATSILEAIDYLNY